MRTLGTLFVAAALAAGAHAQSTGNLLSNPGFEIDQLAPWLPAWQDFVSYAGQWAREDADIVTAENGITPRNGDRMLRLNEYIGLQTQAMQPVDVGSGLAASLIATGTARARVEAWFNLEPDLNHQSRGFVGLHFYSDPTTYISASGFGQVFVDDNPLTWQPEAREVFIPVHTRWIVAEVYYRNDWFGDLTRGYVDDASLVVSVSPVGVPYCDANGVDATPCPCGNDNDGSTIDQRAAGCKNSRNNARGGMLRGSGSASIAADDLVLVATNVPAQQPGLFFQGDNQVNAGLGVTLGDGLRCAGGNTLRLQIVSILGVGTVKSTVDIPSLAMLTPGLMRYYQFWYRDNPSPCTGSWRHNLTNGVEITWLP